MTTDIQTTGDFFLKWLLPLAAMKGKQEPVGNQEWNSARKMVFLMFHLTRESYRAGHPGHAEDSRDHCLWRNGHL